MTPHPLPVPADGCPAEWFPTLTAAQIELVARRARAALAGSPHTLHRTAYLCDLCGGAHITRVTTPAPHGIAA